MGSAYLCGRGYDWNVLLNPWTQQSTRRLPKLHRLTPRTALRDRKRNAPAKPRVDKLNYHDLPTNPHVGISRGMHRIRFYRGHTVGRKVSATKRKAIPHRYNLPPVTSPAAI